MANVELSSLYPPIVETYMPAFVGEQAIIKFKLSPYSDNTLYNFNLTQIVVLNQKTNQTMLNLAKYPNEIKIGVAIKTNDEYSIVINSSDLKSNKFELNTYYKVQIRLTSVNAPSMTGSSPSSSWLNDNIDSFSEWSTVCLIRAISAPSLNILNISKDTLQVPNITGQLEFADKEETEGIDCYRIVLRATSQAISTLGQRVIVEDSNFIYPNTTFENRKISYNFKVNPNDLKTPTVEIYVATRNGYILQQSYNIELSGAGSAAPAEIKSLSIDEENAMVSISLGFNSSTPRPDDLKVSKIIIKRTSSKANFVQWEDIYTYAFANWADAFDGYTFRWLDKTIDGGVWYQYGIQEEYTDGTRSAINIYNKDNPILVSFEHIYLIGDHGTQLKIKYDGTIGSYKKVLQESQVQTLGNKYPFIMRNGNVDYKQFSISGLITALSDENVVQWTHNHPGKGSLQTIEKGNLFTSPTSVYGDSEDLYSKYNKENNVTPYKDIIYEREFREKVIAFLTDGKPKLLKTMTEGNAIVQIMNVNLTPNQQLGRMIYSFSCDAYEVMDNTPENYEKYEIPDTLVQIS